MLRVSFRLEVASLLYILTTIESSALAVDSLEMDTALSQYRWIKHCFESNSADCEWKVGTVSNSGTHHPPSDRTRTPARSWLIARGMPFIAGRNNALLARRNRLKTRVLGRPVFKISQFFSKSLQDP